MGDNIIPFIRKKKDETFENTVIPILKQFTEAVLEGKKETDMEYISADIYDIYLQLKGNEVQINRSEILQFVTASHRLYDGEGNTQSMILSSIIDDIYTVINYRWRLVGLHYQCGTSGDVFDTLDIELLMYFQFTNTHTLVIGITVGDDELPPAA